MCGRVIKKRKEKKKKKRKKRSHERTLSPYGIYLSVHYCVHRVVPGVFSWRSYNNTHPPGRRSGDGHKTQGTSPKRDKMVPHQRIPLKIALLPNIFNLLKHLLFQPCFKTFSNGMGGDGGGWVGGWGGWGILGTHKVRVDE